MFCGIHSKGYFCPECEKNAKDSKSMDDLKRVYVEGKEDDVINLKNISNVKPIFAKKDEKFHGMVILVPELGWVTKIGGEHSSRSGYFGQREDCIIAGQKLGYTYYA